MTRWADTWAGAKLLRKRPVKPTIPMRYYVRRVVQAVITYFTAVTFSFFLYRLLPGGPVQAIRRRLLQEALEEEGGQMSEARLNDLTEVYTGIDPSKPVWEAYIDFVAGIVMRGDFGSSVLYREPVFDILFRAMPWSIFVSVYGLIFGISVTILLGSLMAYKEGSKFDQGSTVLVLVMSSVPYYVAAIVMLSVLAFQWGWFPTGGRYGGSIEPGYNLTFMLSVVRHAALPVITGFIVGFGGGALGMRANAIRLLGAEYIHSARLRGIGTTRITTRYIGRNAVLPIYTGLMIGIAGIFSSSVIMEQIFTYPGVGWYTFEALQARDYPLLMGAFLFFTGLTVLGILMADLTYGLIDPRAGTGEDRETF